MRFNIRVICILLQLLKPELKDQTAGYDLPKINGGLKPIKTRETFTPVARRILPPLRQYSTWLVSQATVIMKSTADGEVNLQMYKSQMWKTYADVVTRFVEVFPDNLESVIYLLQEDMITIGFKPLRDPMIGAESNLYTGPDDKLKPRFTDPGIVRSTADAEMQTRVRDILLCALTLQGKEDSPIKLVGSTFVYRDPSLPVEMSGHASSSSVSSPPHSVTPAASSTSNSLQSSNGHARPLDKPALRETVDTEMHRMVANLVESSEVSYSTSAETSYGMHSQTANEVFAPLGSNGYQEIDSTPKILPSFSGLWTTPFTPHPNELQRTSPERVSSTRSAFAARPQGFSPKPLEEGNITLGHHKNSSWGQMQPIGQGSTSPQYMSMNSSAFSDPSSIYENTTPTRFPAWRSGPFGAVNGNNSTIYPGASDFDRNAMLNSSIWNDSQFSRGAYSNTPPGGQGG